MMNSRQTSVCAGILEEFVTPKTVAEYLGIVLVERFLSSVVVRARDCQTVILEKDGMLTCTACQELKEKMDNYSSRGEVDTKPFGEGCEADVKLEPEVQVKSNEEDEFEFSQTQRHAILDEF